MKHLSIQNLIDIDVYEERKQREQTTWHASSLGNCLRGQFIQRLGIIPLETMTARELRIFKVGKLFEGWVVSLIKNIPDIQMETNLRIVNEKLGVSGYYDLLIKNDPPRIYELKTKHSRAFWYMTKEGKPMRQHEYQLWFYLYGSGIEEGNLVYISKDDLTIQEYVVNVHDQKLKSETLNIINLLNNAWEAKNVALLPLPDKGSWQGKYCRFHKYCVKPELIKVGEKISKQ